MPRHREPVGPRFWPRVDKTETCWLWTGPTSGQMQYGCLSVNGKLTTAHRASYAMHYGPIPEGMCVLHRCDVPRCVRPDHLFMGTVKDNAQDASRKGRLHNGRRSWTTCKRGHDLHVRADGKRRCRTCNAAWTRAKRNLLRTMRAADGPRAA